MPGFDQSGPRGMGPMTGGGRGYCNPGAAAWGGSPGGGQGYGRGGFLGRCGRGAGMGRGWGRGRGWGQPALAVPPADNLETLKAEAASAAHYLETIKKRIEALESD